MIVGILLIEDLFQKEFGLCFEIADHLVVVCGRDQLLKLVQDVDASPRVVGIIRVLKVLDLHEEVEELIEALDDVDIDLEERLERLLALGVLVHRRVVDGVSPHDGILLRQNLAVALDDVACVGFEDGYEAQVKLAMSLDCICVVLDSLYQLALLDVHCFHTETAFFLLQLIVHDFLKTHALKTEQTDQAVVFALVGENVVRV